MKVRGKEEPWCTGPGWYWRGRRESPGHYYGPHNSKSRAEQECYTTLIADSLCGDGTPLEEIHFFRVSQVAIEAEH